MKGGDHPTPVTHPAPPNNPSHFLNFLLFAISQVFVCGTSSAPPPISREVPTADELCMACLISPNLLCGESGGTYCAGRLIDHESSAPSTPTAGVCRVETL